MRHTVANVARSHLDDVHEALEPGEVPNVPGVQPRLVRMGGRCDEQVHDAASRLPADVDDRGGEAAVADGHRLIDWQRIEACCRRLSRLSRSARTPVVLATRTPKFSSASVMALIARTPGIGAT